MQHPVAGYYHRVQPWSRDPARHSLAVDPAAIRSHARMIQRRGLALGRLSEAIADPGRIAALTFDDGYADNLEHGVAALAEAGAVGTVYAVVSQIGMGAADGARMLTPGELRELHALGWEIGSHTLSHPRLPELDEAAQRRELVESKARLEDLLGAPVRSLSYPYGLYSQAMLRIVEEAGYDNAVTTAKRGGADSPFAVSRLSLGGYGLRAAKQSGKLAIRLWRQPRPETAP